MALASSSSSTGYKGAKNYDWYTKLYIDTYEGKLYDVNDNGVNTDHVNTYTLEWLATAEDYSQYDKEILLEFHDAFDEWTEKIFNTIDYRIRKHLKGFLKLRGIYMPTGAREPIPRQLVNLLESKECPIWPPDELKIAARNSAFWSLQLQDMTPTTLSAGTTTPSLPTALSQSPPPQIHPPIPPPPHVFQTPLPAGSTLANSTATLGQPTLTQALTNLAKLYNDDLKFSGDLYDVFNIKLNIFYNLCFEAGVTQDRYGMAFDMMLTGKAQTFYYQHLSQDLNFTEMVTRTRNYFYTPENHQLFLNEWRSLLLKDIIAENRDKTLPQCLEILITRLQRTYQGLVQNYGAGEMGLAGQLVSACQGVPACSSVLLKPATTFEGVVSDLRSAVGIWIRCNPTNQFSYDDSPLSREQDTFYTDRRYVRDDGQHSSSTWPNRFSDRDSRSDRYPNRRRGRLKGSKNKPKTVLASPDAYEIHLAQREQDDLALAKKLRATGKITTSGAPFERSTKAEIEALIARGVFRFETYDPYTHSGIRIFKSRIVNEVKGKTSDQPYEKSRLVIQGYADDGKKIVLTQSPTIQRASQRVIIALAPSLIRKGMTLWLRDITQAYTQSDDPLQRTIIADLPVQLKKAYPSGTIMVVVKPLYGIAEAGAYWWSTYFKHHTDRLQMETSTYDPCLLISKPTAAGFGIVGMQTDDTLGLSDEAFANKETEELRFSAKKKHELTMSAPIDFNGCVVAMGKDGSIALRQKCQGEKLEQAHNQKSYIQQRARGAYIATICQPEASFDLAAAAQSTEPSKEEISRLNKRIKWQKDNVDRGLTHVQLDMEKLKLFALVDASFANNKDMSSQMGYVIVLGNEITANQTASNSSFRIRGNIIHWSSIKCKRITRSVLASEIYAMAHGVDIAIAIRSTIDMIMARLDLPQVPIVACTDSLSLYECLVKLGTTKEKRLMIDIMALREAYERGELKDIRWIDGRDNPADSMTKARANTALETLIDTNELELRVQGWVNRCDRSSTDIDSTELMSSDKDTQA